MKREIPRLGSGWSEIFVYAAIGLGPLCFAWSSSAQTPPRRVAIEAEQVVAAMRDRRLPTDHVQVRLPAAVSASVPAARMKLQSIAPVLPHQLRLRLECRDASECLPFFAMATYPDAVDVSTLESVSDARTEPSPGMQSSAAVADKLPLAKTAAMKNDAMLRAGSTAMLEFEADRLHIRIEVISLQSGVPGSHVRVSSVDHKQIYTAEVITPTLLKGELTK